MVLPGPWIPAFAGKTRVSFVRGSDYYINILLSARDIDEPFHGRRTGLIGRPGDAPDLGELPAQLVPTVAPVAGGVQLAVVAASHQEVGISLVG
jgi:hypothetical protein